MNPSGSSGRRRSVGIARAPAPPHHAFAEQAGAHAERFGSWR